MNIYIKHSKQTARISHTTITTICIQAQTANIFARLFTFETGRLPLETEMFHCSCDVFNTVQSLIQLFFMF
jgi:hypothetical protein